MTKQNKSEMAKKRHGARRAGLQILYQWQLNESITQDMLLDYAASNSMTDVDTSYFQRLFLGVTEELISIDDAIKPMLDRSIQSLDPVELAALRIATYELAHCIEIPYKVVINEAIELVKEFGAEGGHRYINGVLDKLALNLREMETSSVKR